MGEGGPGEKTQEEGDGGGGDEGCGARGEMQSEGSGEEWQPTEEVDEESDYDQPVGHALQGTGFSGLRGLAERCVIASSY